LAKFSFGWFENISTKTGDWADYTSYLVNSVNVLLTPIILYFLIATFDLQRKAIKEQRVSFNAQIKVDGLLRRQSSIITEARHLNKMIHNKLESSANTADYESADFSGPLFDAVVTKNSRVIDFLNSAIESVEKGNWREEELIEFKASRPGDFNYLINVIQLIDKLCDEAKNIDQDLHSIEETVFFEHVSKAFIISMNAEILPITQKFRKLKIFTTVNVDVLSHL
jgi:hypothetical protein